MHILLSRAPEKHVWLVDLPNVNNIERNEELPEMHIQNGANQRRAA